jgi:hypothetical protein
MSYPTTIKGTKVALQLSDGGTPPEFTTVCGINTKGLQRTRAVNDTVLYDCTDPDAIPITEREEGATDWTISGSGFAVLSELDRLEAAYATPADWRIVYFGVGTAVVRSYTGNAIMTDFTLGANNGEKGSLSLTLSGNGVLTPGP